MPTQFGPARLSYTRTTQQEDPREIIFLSYVVSMKRPLRARLFSDTAESERRSGETLRLARGV